MLDSIKKMESPVSAPIQEESSVKVEEPKTSNDVEMTDAPAAEAEPEPAPEPQPEAEVEAVAVAAKPDTKITGNAPESVGSLATVDGVTKDGYIVMNEVVHKLSEYRTEEYDHCSLRICFSRDANMNLAATISHSCFSACSTRGFCQITSR